MPKASLIGLTTSRISSNPPPSTPNSGPSSTSSITCKATSSHIESIKLTLNHNRIISAVTSLGQDIRPPLAPGRPKCNSILHLFGEWLFEAAFIGTDGWSQNLPR